MHHIGWFSRLAKIRCYLIVVFCSPCFVFAHSATVEPGTCSDLLAVRLSLRFPQATPQDKQRFDEIAGHPSVAPFLLADGAEAEDLDRLFAAGLDSAFDPDLHQDPAAFLTKTLNTLLYMIEDNQTHKKVGFVLVYKDLKELATMPAEVLPKNHSLFLAVALDQNHRQSGFAREACQRVLDFLFYEMRAPAVDQVFWAVFSTNQPSLHLAKRLGFRPLVYQGRILRTIIGEEIYSRTR